MLQRMGRRRRWPGRLGARRPPRDHDVVTHNEDWAACAASVDSELMEVTFAELAADLAPVGHRRDLRANGLLYLRGLLMPQVAGNCWSIAEAGGVCAGTRGNSGGDHGAAELGEHVLEGGRSWLCTRAGRGGGR